jgi:HipA-like protein
MPDNRGEPPLQRGPVAGLGDPSFSSVVEVSRAVGTEVVLVPIRLLTAFNHLLEEQHPNPTGLPSAGWSATIPKTQSMAMNATSKRPLAPLSVWIGWWHHRADQRSELFAFTDDYFNSAERPVLSLCLYDDTGKPIISPIVKMTRVPPFFSNLLPEGRLREFVTQQAGVQIGRDRRYCLVVGDGLPVAGGWTTGRGIRRGD